MNTKQLLKSEEGSSILQVLILSSVMIGISLATVSSLLNAGKEQKQITNKIGFAATQNLVKEVLARKEDCRCQIAGRVFDSTSASARIDLERMTVSCESGAPILLQTRAPATSLTVEVPTIRISKITPTGNPDEYSSEVEIGSPKSFLRSVKPLPIPLLFHTSPASPANRKVIVGCGNAPISRPSHFRAIVGPTSGECSFAWDASATGRSPLYYTVRGGTEAGQSSRGMLICEGTEENRTCSIRGLTIGTRYYFSVQASNQYQPSSQFSAEVACVPAQATTVPILSLASSGNAQCNLSWGASSGTAPISYRVYRSTVYPATAANSSLVCETTGLGCTSVGLTNGQTYYYFMTANNVLGASAPSNTVSCTPDTPPECVIALVRNTFVSSANCPTGYTSQKRGRGCAVVGMYDPFVFKGSTFRLQGIGQYRSSSDHYGTLFNLYNETKRVVEYQGGPWYEDRACYYYYHGRATYGDYPWNVCCR